MKRELLAVALALTASAASAADRPLEIRWLLMGQSEVEGIADSIEDELRVATGVETKVEIGQSSFWIFAPTGLIGTSRIPTSIDIFVGYDLVDVTALDAFGAIASAPMTDFSSGGMGAAFVEMSSGVRPQNDSTTLRRVQTRGDVVGFPVEPSLPMVCFDRKRLGHLAEHSPSVLEIAYGKLAQSVAAPDPRTDAAGKALFVSLFEVSGGVNAGWELIGEFNRLVVEYSYDGMNACEAVAAGRAELGLLGSHAAVAVARRLPELGLQLIDGAAPGASHYAVAPSFQDERVQRVVRWLSGERLAARQAAQLDGLIEIGVSPSTVERAISRVNRIGEVADLPVERLLDEWSARYAFRAPTYSAKDSGVPFGGRRN